MRSTPDLSRANILWQPQPGPQTEFHQRTEYEVFYGGARGGGKTDSLLMEGLRQVGHPRYRAIFFRRTYPELEEVIDRSRQLFPRAYPGARWRGDEKQWIFPSGAVYRFRHLQHEADKYNYQGHEYQYVAFDELTHFTLDMYMFLHSSCRTSDPTLTPYIRASGNPGGIGHAWVKDRFIDSCPAVPDGPRQYVPELGVEWQPMRSGPVYVDPTTGLPRAFVPSRVFDNRKLIDNDPNYVRRLLSLPPNMRAAYLAGDWDVFEGQFFDEWDRDTHVVQGYTPPPEWPRFRAMDWGYARPYSIGWYAVMPSGALFRYRELYGYGGSPNVGSRETADEVAAKVARIEEEAGETGIIGPADPACWTRQGHTGPTIAESFSAHGVHFVPADNDRLNGWDQCRKRLQRDRNGEPGFYVADTCRHFIRTVPAMVHSETRPEDVDTDGEDHAGDEWRYMCMYHMMDVAPVVVPGEKPKQEQYTLTHLGTPLIFAENDDTGGSEWWEN